MKTPAQFFYSSAGWSYDPKTETKEQGRRRGAARLAKAERYARDAGLWFEWEIDPDSTSRDFSDDLPHWQLWQCACYGKDGKMLSSLGAIDFGRNGRPGGEDYKRVVEAELALEAMP